MPRAGVGAPGRACVRFPCHNDLAREVGDHDPLWVHGEPGEVPGEDSDTES
jgi:hypothetical protein